MPLVFSLAELFVDGESGLLCVGDREWLEVSGGVEAGDDLAHRSPAGRAFLERLGRHRTAQCEARAAARFAVALTVA